MSFLVTSVPGVQCPVEAGPAWHAWVNAPTTTTSPFTTAWLYTVWCLQSRLPGPNHCGLQDMLPANTLGVHLTAVCETGPGKSTLDAGSARAVAAAGPAAAAGALATAAGALATAAGALATSSPPLASNAVTPATAAVTQRGYVMGPPRRCSLT